MRTTILLALVAALALGGLARADRVDDLTRALLQDSSYKVRVQAALVLGKLKDPRAVKALAQALRDDNATVRGTAAASLGLLGDPSAKDALDAATQDPDGFVSGQAKKALALLSGGGAPVANNKGARFYLAIGFQGGGKAGPEAGDMVRAALAKELAHLPDVQVSSGGVEPTQAVLNQRKLQGFLVDGTIQKLSASMAGGGAQIDCDLKAMVMTYPAKSLKMMTTEGAQLQVSASERESGKRDCVQAVAEAIRDDVAKYLKTVQ